MTVTMLDVKIDRQEPTDLFEQVAAEIRRAIADGEASLGSGYLRQGISPPCSE